MTLDDIKSIRLNNTNIISMSYEGDIIWEAQTEPQYTECEYIQSSGTQYIDTGISGGTIAEYEIDMSTLNTLAHAWEQYFAGDRSTTNLIGKLYNNNNYLMYQGFPTNTDVQLVAMANLKRQIKVTVADGIKVDTTPIMSYSGAPWGTSTFWVFNSHNESNLGASMRLYKLVMYTDGVKVRDFIPVLDENDVACLYDKVSKQFFYNQGTGTFTYQLKEV